MKRFLVALFLVFVFLVSSFLMYAIAADDILRVVDVWSDTPGSYKGFTNTITTNTSMTIDLSAYKPRGEYSLEVQVKGTGNIERLTYQVSNLGSNFCTVQGPILTAFGPTSGTNSDGKAFLTVSPPPCKFIRYVAIISNGAASVQMLMGIK